jgi:hypothetical protein
VRVAIDEAEAWLMADREGFAEFYKVPLNKIPESKSISRRRLEYVEMNFPYKSSLFMLREIIPFTTLTEYKTTLIAKDGISKGPEYNTSILPFIRSWDITNACRNSTSLQRTVNRLKSFANNKT